MTVFRHARIRRSLPIAAVLAASLALGACLGAAPKPAPAPAPTTTTTKKAATTTTTTTAPPPAGVACEAVETLSLDSEAPDATAYEAVVDDGAGGTEYVTFEAASGEEFYEQIAEIEAMVGVVTDVAEQGEVGVLQVTPGDDPRYGTSGPQKQALDQARFDQAWANAEDGAGVVIAVVDTGVQGDHEDLAGNLLPGVDFVSDGGGTCVDSHGHGTHVAGIGGQVDNTIGGIGGALGAKILPVRVLDESGSGTFPDVAAGIDWAVEHEADVINLSLGGESSAPSVETAIENAVAAGVTVVAAAGNCGAPSDKCSSLNAPSYPAALPDVIAVGAITTGSVPPTKASFSNDNDYVDVAAPGTSIDSTYRGNSYTTMSGTSMATPFVSAVAALILRDCTLSAEQVRVKIQTSASVDAQGFAELVQLVDAAAAGDGC